MVPLWLKMAKLTVPPCNINPCQLDEDQDDDCEEKIEGPCSEDIPSVSEETDPCEEPEPEVDPCEEPEPEYPEPCDEPEEKDPEQKSDNEQNQAEPTKGKSASRRRLNHA